MNVRSETASVPTALHLFPMAISGPEQIDRALGVLWDGAQRSSSFGRVLSECWEEYLVNQHKPLTLVLLASCPEGLRREVHVCRQTWSQNWTDGRDWKSPAGSYLAVRPLGAVGKVAFVYPGIGSLYPGYSRDLLTCFPQALDDLPAVSRDELIAMLHREHLWPSNDDPHNTTSSIFSDDWPLYRDIVAQAEATVSLAYVWTQLLQRVFGLRPEMALGYSLGEVAMFAACGCWQKPQELSARFRTWPSFSKRLSGDMTILHDSPATKNMSAHEWLSCVVPMTGGNLSSALPTPNSRVFVTHVNTSREVVVAGASRDVNEWLSHQGLRGQPLPSRLIYHCETLAPEAAMLETLFELPVSPRPEIDFVAMPPFSRVPHSSKSLARVLVNTALQTVDWPQIVETAYGRGARVFVEVGPRNSCSSWIQSILDGQAHATASTDRKGFDVVTSLSRMLAILLSHRVPLSTSSVCNWSQQLINS